MFGEDVHNALVRIEPAVQPQALAQPIPAAQVQVQGLQIELVEYRSDYGADRVPGLHDLAERFPGELPTFVAQQPFPRCRQQLEPAIDMRSGEQDVGVLVGVSGTCGDGQLKVVEITRRSHTAHHAQMISARDSAFRTAAYTTGY